MTRPSAPADSLSRRLDRAGAIIEPIPTIRIVDPPDPRPLAEAAARYSSYDWAVLTSANGVERLAGALSRAGLEPPGLGAIRVAAIGSATAAAVRERGAEPSVVPDVHRGEALAEALIAAATDLTGARILLARADEARDVLPRRLRAAGAIVDDVPAYVTEPDRSAAPALRAAVSGGELDWITFTASSAVRAFVELAGPATGGAAVAAIGPITAATVRDAGLGDPVVAGDATSRGVVDAIVEATAA